MTTNPIPPKVRKLRNLRTILWIVFAAIAITIILVGSLSLPAALWANQTSNLSTLFVNETRLLLLSIVAIMLVKIAITGIICVVIYAIVKYRLNKDDDLFL